MDHSLGDNELGGFTRDSLTFLTYGMIVAFGFAVAAMGPAMPLLRQDLGISRTIGGLHFTAIASGSVLAGLTIRRVVEPWGRRRVFWSGGAGVATGCLLLMAGWHPAITLSGCFVIGGFGSAVLIMSQAALSDRHPSHRPVALTEANTAMSVGTVAPALFIGAFVAVGAGWRPALLAPVCIWLALVLSRSSVAFPPASIGDRPGRSSVLPRTYWLFWAGFIPAVGAEWSIGAWGADYLVDVAETTEGSASFLMSAFFGAMVIGRLAGSRIARSLSPFSLLLGSTAVGLGGVILFWAADSLPLIVGGLFVSGLGISMLFPMLLSLAIGIAPDQVDTAAARIAIAAGGSVIVAPLTLGALADQVGIRGAFLIVPGLLVLVVVLAILGRRMEAAQGAGPAQRPGSMG